MKPQYRSALAGLAVLTLLATAAGQGTAAPVGPPIKPNPYLSYTVNPADTDWKHWRPLMEAEGKERARSATLAQSKAKAAGKALTAPIEYHEAEPGTVAGGNDSSSEAEQIKGFGTRQNARLHLQGTLADPAGAPAKLDPSPEDNGSIPLATPTGIDPGATGRLAITTTGVLGDGPHGPDGTGTNDFDFYRAVAKAGFTLHVDTNGSGNTDTLVAVYDSAGQRLAQDDDNGIGVSSSLDFVVPADGEYFVLVTAFSLSDPFPADPADPASGQGGAITGDYQLAVSAAPVDKDFFAVDLVKGDVLGASVAGQAHRLTVFRPDGSQAQGSAQDVTFSYPAASPLPGGGNAALAYVAERTGRYYVGVQNGSGAYDATVEAYRPGTESASTQQTIFLDFDGARINTAIFYGPGVRQLSPFASYLARWGLPASAEADLVKRITAVVTENIRTDLIAKGLNPNVAVKVLNSRDHADPFGQPNVSRVIIGGSIAEAGIGTIGIAESVDPGNFGHEESALVLLDTLSAPDGDASANSYLRPGSDRRGFVSRVVGNVAAHEIGHLLGDYHVDETNTVADLMDQGGNFGVSFGVGPDGTGGTADDTDVDFGRDALSPVEGFDGLEDTLNTAAWGLTKPKN